MSMIFTNTVTKHSKLDAKSLDRGFIDGLRDSQINRFVFTVLKITNPYAFFREAGLSKWAFSRRHPVLKPLAFIYGVLVAAGKGIKAFFRTAILTSRSAKAVRCISSTRNWA